MQTFRKLTPRRRLATAVVVLTIGVLGVVPWKLAARETPDQPASAASPQERAKEADAPQDDPTSSSRTITIHGPSEYLRGVPPKFTRAARCKKWYIRQQNIIRFRENLTCPSMFHDADPTGSGITKEISTKGKESRFKKTDRGRFAGS